jgi:hypothetical protein
MSSRALFIVPILIEEGGALTFTNVGSELDPAAWDVATAYALGDRVTDGTSIYESIQAGTGHAVADLAYWVRVGAVNRLRMFDRRVGAQTENDDSIEVNIVVTDVVNVVSVRNVDALAINLQQVVDGPEIVYNRTVNLDEPVGDWFEYFFAPITHQTEAVFTDLLPIAGCLFVLRIVHSGSVVKCGEVLMGPALDAGITEAGVSDGIDDYSIVSPDEFGVRDIVERDFADNMDLTVYVNESRSPSLKRLLTANRARPILVIAADDRPDAQVYGLAESWRRVLSYPDTDVFNITMKGLT